MTDAIVWADKLPDIIKKWILVVPMLFALGGSGLGIYQTYSKGVALEEAETIKNKAVHEVTIGFQTVLAEKPEIPQARVYEKPRNPAICVDCIKRIEKLERWH